MPDLTIVTPTADQPTGMALCERFVARQTVKDVSIQWIVVDDGQTPAVLTQRQEHVLRPREVGCTGAQSLCRNLLAALPLVQAPIVVFWEHDDWYRADYLETRLDQLNRPGVKVAGDDEQRYYHVGRRAWRIFQNRGASLCQTAMVSEMIPAFTMIVEGRLRENSYGVDGHFWATLDPAICSLQKSKTVVGIKGLPGRHGLGVGHRNWGGYTADPDLTTLRAWIGDDVDLYRSFGEQGATMAATRKQ